MRPFMWPLACMEIADRVHPALARSRRLDISLVFLTPSLTVAPYLSSDLPASLTASDRDGVTPPRPELCRFRRAPSAPRRSSPSCWPARPPPACAASWPACGPARGLPAIPLSPGVLSHAELAPMISSRRRLRSPIFEVRPSRSLPPLECCLGVASQPGGEVTSAAEGRGPQGPAPPAPWRRPAPTPGMVIRRPATWIGFGSGGDLAIKHRDPRLDRLQALGDHRQHRARSRLAVRSRDRRPAR